MATSVRQAILTSNLTVYARFGGANLQAQDDVINGCDETQIFNAASTPDVDSPPFTKDLTLTGGADTLDLYGGLTDPEGNAISITGKKLRAIKLVAKASNSGNITINDGVTSGYELAGDAWKLILTPGMSALINCQSAAPVIDNTHKNIAYTGTLNDILKVVAIFG